MDLGAPAPCAASARRRRSLFDALPRGMQLEALSASDGPFATHIRYRVLK
jgi:hypothetical protein